MNDGGGSTAFYFHLLPSMDDGLFGSLFVVPEG